MPWNIETTAYIRHRIGKLKTQRDDILDLFVLTRAFVVSRGISPRITKHASMMFGREWDQRFLGD